MSKVVPELLGGLLPALPNLSTVNHNVMFVGGVINAHRTKGKIFELHPDLHWGEELEELYSLHALFFEVMTEKADQRCSTCWLPQGGQVMAPSS